MNDNTRNPARLSTRELSKQILEAFHLPWILQVGATPVFLWTHAYIPLSSSSSGNNRDMAGLEDIANFTSLTYVGLQEYAAVLAPHLDANHQPLIAPSGLAWLLIYEENLDLWKTLFHGADHIHASPSGTLLQGLVMYHTLFGELPDKNSLWDTTSSSSSSSIESLWQNARMMQHAWEPPNPFPTAPAVDYLYRIAERICIEGEIPKSFIPYQNGEAAYTPPTNNNNSG